MTLRTTIAFTFALSTSIALPSVGMAAMSDVTEAVAKEEAQIKDSTYTPPDNIGGPGRSQGSGTR